jgi:alpha-beta hydrolase superfamily lysophospholipase
MIRIRRYFIRLVVVLGILAAILLGVVAWYGSERLVSPQRRALQDYHRDILGHPDNYGLHIQAFTGPEQTPCLLVTASANPGEAKKSRIARQELARRGVSLPPWGSQIGTIVLLYGHSGRKEDHLPICERFTAAGFRCLLMDIPGQGDHPAACGTFGVTEAPLIEKVVGEAASKFAFAPAPVCLFGVSQGGAIALQTAARSPGKWAAVASVATFSSLDRPVLKTAEEMVPEHFHFCCPLAAVCVGCGTRVRAGFWPEDVRPVDAAAKLNMPVFIAHGDNDPYIGIDQARDIFAAVPGSKKAFRVVKGANHNNVLATGSHELYADICQFFLEAVQHRAPDFERAE